MNKELIKKYKEEFDYFISQNQNQVLMGKKDHFTNKIKWYPSVSNPFLELSDNIIIIKNDEYAEFRKALAEGKTIQIINKFSNELMDLPMVVFSGPAEYYRIKPEEPQFKVGDFVRYIHSHNNKALKINNINCGFYYFDDTGISLRIDEMIKWEPQAGELCWFTHDIGVKNVGYLKEFKEISADTSYRDCYGNKWRYCEPFLNSKPSWFKE